MRWKGVNFEEKKTRPSKIISENLVILVDDYIIDYHVSIIDYVSTKLFKNWIELAVCNIINYAYSIADHVVRWNCIIDYTIFIIN